MFPPALSPHKTILFVLIGNPKVFFSINFIAVIESFIAAGNLYSGDLR